MKHTHLLSSVLLVAATGCAIDEVAPLEEELESTESAIELLGNYNLNGQSMSVIEMDTISVLTMRIASCGHGVLYSTKNDNTLWVNLTGGAGDWTQVTGGAMGTKIACDRRHLYSMDSGGKLWHAFTLSNGQLQAYWSNKTDGVAMTLPAGTVEIQGGMGNIYALVKEANNTYTLHGSELKNPTSDGSYQQGSAWTQLASGLGTDHVTGAGSKAAYTGITTSLPYRKMRRAVGANPDDSLYFNDTLLDGQNYWTSFPRPAGVTIQSITADDSNTFYALSQNGFGKRIVQFNFKETNCTDGKDNDASGETDAEDPACRTRLAQSWCSTHTGSYCIDRIESTGSPAYSHALVTCSSSGFVSKIEDGLCTKGTTGNDYLTPERVNNAPSGSGQYCNVHNPDGTWDFDYTGTDPCAELHTEHPNSTTVRSGLYSTTGTNDVHVRCTNGWYTTSGTGTAPIAEAFAAIGKTANECLFMVSPRRMAVFNAPFPTSAWAKPLYGGRGYSVGHVFDHVPTCEKSDPGCPCSAADGVCTEDLSYYGQSGVSSSVDNLGKHHGYDEQDGYDYNINEGTPMRSLGWGTVISSRRRDLASHDALYNARYGGTPFQEEVYVRYTIGSNPDYAESFVAYYAHLGKRSVVTGQTVAPGQLLGYSGTSGSSSDPHLHFSVLRITNTNARSSGAGAVYGHRHNVQPTTSTQTGMNRAAKAAAVDPYGWRAPYNPDPWAFKWSNATKWGVTGIGAWAPVLFMTNETPPYSGQP